MKKIFFLTMFLVSFISLCADDAIDWSCSGDAECPKEMPCVESLCKPSKDKFADYATISLATGENNPNSRGSDKIFVTHPAKDLVLGQLAVNAYTGGGEGKLFLIKEISADISVYPTSIKFEDFKLVYDANGNGVADSSEQVVAEGIVEGYGVRFPITRNLMAYNMNKAENFLIIGSFSSDKGIPDLAKFNITIRSDENYIKIVTKSDIAKTGNISFPNFSFEPESGYFLFASGKHFPKAPAWTEINKEQEVMHLRAKALDGANELRNIRVELYGTSASFGNGVDRIALYADTNNDGKGDALITEISNFEVPQQFALLQIPEGKLILSEKEEIALTIRASMNFYKDQNTYFYITDSDVVLKTKQKIAGTTIKTDSFKYSCKEEDPECRLKPEEGNDSEGGDGGCSLLFID